MRYMVALGFDYFDGDFRFGDLESDPLLPDMWEDALSEGYVRMFDGYDEAAAFAREVVARICDRADVAGDEGKRSFIGCVRDRLLADVIAMTMGDAGDAHVTFDVSEEWGNWEIRVRLLRRAGRDGVWEYPDCP